MSTPLEGASKERKKRKWDQPAEGADVKTAAASDSSGLASSAGLLPFANMGGNTAVSGMFPMAGLMPGMGFPAGMGIGQMNTMMAAVQQNAAAMVQKLNQELASKGLLPKASSAAPAPVPVPEEPIFKEIVINDAEPGIRYKLTKRGTQEEIQHKTGAVVITRGRYRPPNESEKPGHEKPLYLHVSSGINLKTPEEKKKAVSEAAEMIEEMLKGAKPQVPAELSCAVYPNLEMAEPSFNLLGRLQGPNNQYVGHIMNETGARIVLRGRGSKNLEGRGAELSEPLHFHITCPHSKGLEDARRLAQNLVDTVKADYYRQRDEPSSTTQQPPAVGPSQAPPHPQTVPYPPSQQVAAYPPPYAHAAPPVHAHQPPSPFPPAAPYAQPYPPPAASAGSSGQYGVPSTAYGAYPPQTGAYPTAATAPTNGPSGGTGGPSPVNPEQLPQPSSVMPSGSQGQAPSYQHPPEPSAATPPLGGFAQSEPTPPQPTAAASPQAPAYPGYPPHQVPYPSQGQYPAPPGGQYPAQPSSYGAPPGQPRPPPYSAAHYGAPPPYGGPSPYPPPPQQFAPSYGGAPQPYIHGQQQPQARGPYGSYPPPYQPPSGTGPGYANYGGPYAQVAVGARPPQGGGQQGGQGGGMAPQGGPTGQRPQRPPEQQPAQRRRFQEFVEPQQQQQQQQRNEETQQRLPQNGLSTSLPPPGGRPEQRPMPPPPPKFTAPSGSNSMPPPGPKTMGPSATRAISMPPPPAKQMDPPPLKTPAPGAQASKDCSASGDVAGVRLVDYGEEDEESGEGPPSLEQPNADSRPFWAA